MIEVGRLRAALKKIGLDRYEEAIQAVALPAIAVHLGDGTREEFPVGKSRFGGDPDLSGHVAWPTMIYGSDDDEYEAPLQFLAQFDLTELANFTAASALPKSGLLSFFYDIYETPGGVPKDRGAWRILYQADTESLVRRASPPPPEGYEYCVAIHRRLDSRVPSGFDTCHLVPRALSFSEFTSLPKQNLFSSPENVEALWEAETAGFDVDPVDRAKLHLLYELPFDVTLQLFGHSAAIHDPMQEDCERALRANEAGHTESGSEDIPMRDIQAWKLLLQVDTLPECMWGDSGTIYFWMRDEDLVAGRYEKSWLQLQCC